MNQLLQWPGAAAETLRFAAVEGLSCQTGLLDGPAGLLTSLLACGPSSDAGLAALQAGQHIPSPLYMLWAFGCAHPHKSKLQKALPIHTLTMCTAC